MDRQKACASYLNCSCGKCYGYSKEESQTKWHLGGKGVSVSSSNKDVQWVHGGVDLADQRIATYKKHLKTSTWYLALFYHCLEQSCLNAFVVDQANPVHVRPKCTQLQFCEDLMTKLIGGRSYVKKVGRPSTPVAAETRFDHGQFHHLVKTESKSLLRTCSGSPHSVSVCCLWATNVCRALFPAISHPSAFQI